MEFLLQQMIGGAFNDLEALVGVPEVFESEVTESIIARTHALSSFREIGPPDLCHIIKTNPRGSDNDVGSFHHVLGLDTSSPASIAAYMNSLANKTAPNSPWKVRSGLYCCYNAFSRIDIRVEVRIPGGVHSYIVDSQGQKHAITNPAIWDETYVSAVMRSILDNSDEADSDPATVPLGLRKMDAIPNIQAEKMFLKTATVHFWKGWQLGTFPEVQVATLFSNHLTNSILKYFSESGRMKEAVAFFEPLATKDVEVVAPLARSLIESDNEIAGIKVLHDGIKSNPRSYGQLMVQIDFLRGKRDFASALKVAKRAVSLAPNEYVTWEALTAVYIDQCNFSQALLALNSCPMFTHFPKDFVRMPPPPKFYLPLKTPNENEPLRHGTLADNNDPRENDVHPELQRLPAHGLQGTFLRAYNILLRLVAQIGWDELLRIRSKVFVMEAEYREASSQATSPTSANAPEGSTSSTAPAAADKSEEKNLLDLNAPEVSQTDVLVQELVGGETANDANASSGNGVVIVTENSAEGTSNGTEPVINKRDSSLFAPPKTPIGAESQSQRSLYADKRLCEKWLDNLFLILYNDLRLYSALKKEMSQYNSGDRNKPYKQLLYRKTGAEWEIYGDLARRLGHYDDATVAYRLALDQRFSMTAWLRMIDMAVVLDDRVTASEMAIKDVLTACLKVLVYWDAMCVESLFPNPVSRALFALIKKHGYVLVQNQLVLMFLPQKTYRLITRYLDHAEMFQIGGIKY